MTQRYAHLRDESLRAASDLAGSIIEQATNGKNKVVSLRAGLITKFPGIGAVRSTALTRPVSWRFSLDLHQGATGGA